jgi:hypothetical protein
MLGGRALTTKIGQLRGLSCERVQVDEIWAFCYAKQRNVAAAKTAPDQAGDLWTWTAIDADNKLATPGSSVAAAPRRRMYSCKM